MLVAAAMVVCVVVRMIVCVFMVMSVAAGSMLMRVFMRMTAGFTACANVLVGMIVRVFVAGTAGMLMDMFVRGFLCLAPCKDLAPYLAYISKWMALPAGAQRHGGFTHIFLQSGLSEGGTALPFSSIVTG